MATHELPPWYDDAKLGIFLHWGLYSVPGWAPQVPDIQELLLTRGPKAVLRQNPYAEWYGNSMRLEGSPTWWHHRRTFGDGYPYDNFATEFDEASAGADLDALAACCREAGARYVVLTTKHHDGFCLWPASAPHPVKGRYRARRDLVGDLTRAVRAAGMRMGLYYSGGYDWPYNGAVLANPADVVLAVPRGEDYRRYATAHVRELVDRYRPSVLWNDIGWPAGGNLAQLFAHYYNRVDDGLVNDRWTESWVPRTPVTDALARGLGDLVQVLWPLVPDRHKRLAFPTPRHFDVSTPEYRTFDRVVARKWESTRGVGHSFGANRNERPEDIVTATELIRSFVDIVSKNGNLLVGIGPRPDGTVPEEQRVPLRALGRWLADHEEAVIGSRPWGPAAGSTSEGTPVRYTQRDGVVYALLLGLPGTTTFSLPDVQADEVPAPRLLGRRGVLASSVDDGRLTVTLPDRPATSAVHVLRLGTGLRPARR